MTSPKTSLRTTIEVHLPEGTALYKKRNSLTPEHRQKISTALSGVPKPEGFGARVSATLSGRPLSDDHRQRISLAKKGIVPSEETRRRMSEAQTRRKAREATERLTRGQ